MSRHSAEQTRANAAMRQLLAEERAREAERRIADEAKRQTDTAAKTAKFRDLRLTREAAEREAPKPGKAKGRRK